MLRFILVGPSGSGKTTLANMLEKRGLKRCVTATTRPARCGEINGVEYHFIKKEDFNEEDFFESVSFGGEKYGSKKDEIDTSDFIILEPKGIETYKSLIPSLKVIFVDKKNEIETKRQLRDKDIFNDVRYDFIIKPKNKLDAKVQLIKILKENSLL